MGEPGHFDNCPAYSYHHRQDSPLSAQAQLEDLEARDPNLLADPWSLSTLLHRQAPVQIPQLDQQRRQRLSSFGNLAPIVSSEQQDLRTGIVEIPNALQSTHSKRRPAPQRNTHGSSNITSGLPIEKPLATSGTGDQMASKGAKEQAKPSPSRPPMTSHQSNSVPSTPLQHARDFQFRSRSRSPSPHLTLASHSPRSVTSEANRPMASLGRPTCKYETSLQYGKRRIQYDIGDAPLDKAEKAPKATLEPHEEDKLSGDMRELYDRLLPSTESEQRRQELIRKLETILRSNWPSAEFKVHVFGSSGNMLCTSESDGIVRSGRSSLRTS